MTAPLAAPDLCLATVLAQLDRVGCVCLDDAISEEWLEAARDSVNAYLAEYGERDLVIVLPSDAENTPAINLVADPKIEALLTGLARRRCARGVLPGEGTRCILRVLAGPVRDEMPFCFHYDASVVTMVVPILIPDAGPGSSGELVVFQNKRPFRRFTMINILEKAIMSSGLYRNRMVRKFYQERNSHIIQQKPGNAYIFWGYRTFHGNAPQALGTTRATLLLHFGNPHGRSPLLRAAMYLRRQMRELPISKGPQVHLAGPQQQAPVPHENIKPSVVRPEGHVKAAPPIR